MRVRKGEAERKEGKEGNKGGREEKERRREQGKKEGCRSTILVWYKKCVFSPYRHRSEVQSQFQRPGFLGKTSPKSLPPTACG